MSIVMFVLTILLLILFLALVGKNIGVAGNRRWNGVIIDNRNRVSLSKLQMACWTILIFAGLCVAFGMRLQDGSTVATALNITIPANLLTVMGISAASMVATPALLSLKKPETGSAVDSNSSISAARWTDIFRGDDTSNHHRPDLSKIQQFLITGLLLCYYGIHLGSWLMDAHAPNGPMGAKATLPNFGENVAWLLGISHAGYLGYKAVPHTVGNTASLRAKAKPSSKPS